MDHVWQRLDRAGDLDDLHTSWTASWTAALQGASQPVQIQIEWRRETSREVPNHAWEPTWAQGLRLAGGGRLESCAQPKRAAHVGSRDVLLVEP